MTTNNHTIAYSKLDAVLPITLKDYGRFTILQKTLKIFCEELLEVVWVVVPDRDFPEIKSRIKEKNYEVIPESKLVPEFNLFPKRSGWFKQQLIKLAITENITTDFYLTLDADVICVKPTLFSDLVKDGRAVYYVYSLDKFEFPEWYEWAERVLQLQSLGRCRYHNVTPSVLSKQAALQVQKYLNGLSLSQIASHEKINFFRKNDLLLLLSRAALKVLPENSTLRDRLSGWKAYLLRNIPWTEYSVYYTFCEFQGLIDKYHIQTEHCIYSTENSVWYKRQYSDWLPERCFTGERDFFFSVFQSTTEVESDEIWEKIKVYL